MKLLKSKLFPPFYFFILALVFFRSLLTAHVPIPLDALTGMYYPYLNQKFGYAVGVPVKNPAISDAYSQHYPWRVEAIRQWQEKIIPLWNPYVFSGAPLLANWQSTPFYPLNLFMLLFGELSGWSLICFFQPIIAGLCMYFFLRTIGMGKFSSLFGSTVFAYCAYSIIFLTYSTFGHSMALLPLIFATLTLYLRRPTTLHGAAISLTILLLVLAGNFQIALYAISVAILFAASQIILSKQFNWLVIIKLLCFLFLGLALSAFYLLPIFELFQHSFRSTDANIAEYKYGLIPLRSLLTFLAPDFFGNPATNNFFGFLYHETSFYLGLAPIGLALTFIFSKTSKTHLHKFFIFVFFLSLAIVLYTPLGKLVYTFHVPFLSTSYASRFNSILSFSAIVLSVFSFAELKNNLLTAKKVFVVLSFILFFLLIFTKIYSKNHLDYLISFRNLLFPSLLSVLIFSTLFIKKIKVIYVLLLLLTIFDLFRFGQKYTPFVPANLNFPTTPSLSFLTNNLGNYRFDKEKGEILPSNAWMFYRLSSPGGYDPLYPNSYASFYNVYNGGPPTATPSRYAEWFKYDTPFTDLLGVKYILALKRNKNGIPDPTGSLNPEFKPPRFTEVFTEGPLTVLENTTVLPRALVYTDYTVDPDPNSALTHLKNTPNFRQTIILDSAPTFAPKPSSATATQIVSYQANKVVVTATSSTPALVFLSDTMYPGWQVTVNGQDKKILTAFGTFRAVEIGAGESHIEFVYHPTSFYLGLKISLVAAGLLFIFLSIYFFPKKKL